MTKIFKAILLASAPVALAVSLPSVALAQAVTNVAVANVEEAVQRSNAFTAAVAQIKTTYKAQIDAFDARQKSLQAELQPLVTAFQTAQRAPNPNQAALQTQATNIQTRQQAAQRELQNLAQPFGRAQAYVEEQISAKLEPALKAAMVKRKVNLVISPQAAISYQPTADITGDIATELNALMPSASIAVPANWQPGGQGQAAPAPAAAKPQGR
ncbi:MAG: OmpH family outer membrane protein [Pseudomonadota bacterium]